MLAIFIVVKIFITKCLFSFFCWTMKVNGNLSLMKKDASVRSEISKLIIGESWQPQIYKQAFACSYFYYISYYLLCCIFIKVGNTYFTDMLD